MFTNKEVASEETTELKRARNGSVTVGVDHNMLRIQLPSEISQKFWGKPQKYLYLKLKDTPENRLLAELVSRDIQLDLADNYLDLTLQRYLQALEEYRPKPTNQNSTSFPDLLSSIFKKPTLSGLFTEYSYYKSKFLAETTMIFSYQARYGRAFHSCPQNLNEGLKIQSYLMENHSSGEARRLISVIANMVEWAKLNQKLPANFLNVYKQYREEIKVVSRRESAQTIQELIHAGIIGEREPEFRAFTIEEANAIIQAFEERICLNNHTQSPWDLVIKFLFWTGCRPGECAALRWSQVAADCSKITFNASWSREGRFRKGLKTEGKGASSRSFPCGSKLQNFLLSIRPENYTPETYVFSNRAGKPIDFATFHMLWVGRNGNKHNYVGILPTLIKEGKVEQYLPPYATRHTYINIQLDAGVRIADVAKLVGNSPATIHNHYESASREKNKIQPIEI